MKKKEEERFRFSLGHTTLTRKRTHTTRRRPADYGSAEGGGWTRSISNTTRCNHITTIYRP